MKDSLVSVALISLIFILFQTNGNDAKRALVVSKDATVLEDVKRFAAEREVLVVDTNDLTNHRRKRSQSSDVCETVWIEYLRKLGEVNKQQAKYDDIQNRISTLKNAIELEKIDTCREYVAGFGDPLKVNGRSTLMGTFMNDLADGRDEIWVSDGCCEITTLYEFKTLTDFKNNKVYRTHKLQTPCDGTGHVIYDANLYCNKKNSNIIFRFDLNNRNNTAEVTLSGAGYRNTYPYQFFGYSDMDFAVDEQGLWVIYATSQNHGNMVISRLAFDDLSVLSTFETNFQKKLVGNTFMACGVLYATSSYIDSPTYIVYMFDTNDATEKFLNQDILKLRILDYGNGRTSTFMLDYNPKDKQLYAWTYMNQVTYKVLRKF